VLTCPALSSLPNLHVTSPPIVSIEKLAHFVLFSELPSSSLPLWRSGRQRRKYEGKKERKNYGALKVYELRIHNTQFLRSIFGCHKF
jgi:hypothetical protein